jgi:hypothetical protein
MATIFYIRSDAPRTQVRETEHEYFTRLAREHTHNRRRARRQRVLNKITRRAPRDRRPAA